jgi:hypothetical protein
MTETDTGLLNVYVPTPLRADVSSYSSTTYEMQL